MNKQIKNPAKKTGFIRFKTKKKQDWLIPTVNSGLTLNFYHVFIFFFFKKFLPEKLLIFCTRSPDKHPDGDIRPDAGYRGQSGLHPLPRYSGTLLQQTHGWVAGYSNIYCIIKLYFKFFRFFKKISELSECWRGDPYHTTADKNFVRFAHL